MADESARPPEFDDAKLLSLVRAGDSVAFGVLSERHAEAARRLARDLVVSPAEVDDVVTATFARVQEVVRRGDGPADAFRCYLLTAVRRTCEGRYSAPAGAGRTEGNPGAPDPGAPGLAGPGSELIVRAFRTLPERWAALLWHMEVEEENPADVTPLFGLSLNGLAALERRAREGLRQTALDGYVARLTRPGCLPVAERLGAYLRYTLPEPRASEVAVHLAGCAECRAIYAELVDVGATLRTHVAPVFLGSVAAAYLSGAEYHHIAVGQVAEAAADPAGPAAAAAGLAGSDAAASGSGEVSSGLTKTELASTALASTALASTGLANPGLADAGGAGAPPGAGGPPGDPGTGPGHAGGPAVGPVAGAGGPYGLLLAMRRHPRIAAAGGAVLVVIAAVAFALAPSGHKPAPHAADPSPQAGAGGSVGLATGGRPGTVVQTPSPSASTAHSRPPASSSPARGASSGPAGGTSPSASASPDPSPTPSAAPDVTLSASVSVFGGGNMAQVVFQVGDTGSAATSGLSASIGLPSGAAMVAGGNGRHHDPWSCQPTSSGASCQHDPISAGQQTFGVILIQLNGAAACGQPVQLTVTSGSVSASAQSPQTIQCGNRGNARGAGGLAAGPATGLAAS